jgi:DNA-directed RNA polymerase subunit RPC12/RpoP
MYKCNTCEGTFNSPNIKEYIEPTWCGSHYENRTIGEATCIHCNSGDFEEWSDDNDD